MKRIALKIDVDTYQGTLAGIPALIELLQRYDASGTFFLSLGPDHAGRETRSSSLNGYYGLSTRLYGRLLPGPNIGLRCAEAMLLAQTAGFEVGIHAWNRVSWEQNVLSAENSWVEAEMEKACTRFVQLFPETVAAHGAAGWRMNRHALRLTQRLGFAYASDCRGDHPFVPVIDGEIVACAQIPTTLPTLDEILVLEPGFSPEQALDRIFQLSNAVAGDHVFTLRAELEGMKFLGALERLLVAWKSQGYSIVAMRDAFSAIDVKALPRHTVRFAEMPGRLGVRMVQGPLFPQI